MDWRVGLSNIASFIVTEFLKGLITIQTAQVLYLARQTYIVLQAEKSGDLLIETIQSAY